jgi:peptidoglycan/LPS O-acetylase OafA/YrhL
LAVLIVVIGHCGFGHYVPTKFGVTIFFFLSGYLITALLLQEWEDTGHISIASFYLRRVYRLMPALLLLLSIVYPLARAGFIEGKGSSVGFMAQLFYFANYYEIFGRPEAIVPAGTSVLWSLAVEEHFYLVYPAMLSYLLSRSIPRSQIAQWLAAVAVAVLVWRFYLVFFCLADETRIYLATDTRIDSILFGCILALISKGLATGETAKQMVWRDWLLLIGAVALVVLTIAIRSFVFRETVRYTIQGLALIPIFYFATRFPSVWPFRILNHRYMTKIGDWSYAIYLLHYVVALHISKNYPELFHNTLATLVLVMTVSIAFAITIDQLIDPYFRRLRSELRPVQAQS